MLREHIVNYKLRIVISNPQKMQCPKFNIPMSICPKLKIAAGWENCKKKCNQFAEIAGNCGKLWTFNDKADCNPTPWESL